MWRPRVRQNRFNCPIGFFSAGKHFILAIYIYKKIIIASFFGQVAEYLPPSYYYFLCGFFFSWTVFPVQKGLESIFSDLDLPLGQYCIFIEWYE